MKLKSFVGLALLAMLWIQSSNALAQNTVLTYQGRVQDNGTNFTGTGQFQFALVTSSNINQTATAIASNPVSGFITTIAVTFGGSGYVAVPAVTISGGGGSGAAATAALSNGVVSAITINAGGNGTGYTSAPTVTVAPPPANLVYTTYWSNDGTSVAGSEPAASVSVGVANGLFLVHLGDTTVPNMSAISAGLFSQPNLQLQIWFNDGVNGFANLTPVQNLTYAPYAAFAVGASNLLGGVSAAQLNGMVPSSALPTNAVFSGPVTATVFSGSGSNLTSLNAASLSGGPVPLTSLGGITSNQLDAATWQLATNLNGGNAALASNVVSGISITNVTLTNSSFAGNGAWLTSLPAAQLVSIGNTNGSAAGNFFAGAAGNPTMAGYNNTGIGVHALIANSNGLNNVAIGLNTLHNNGGGNENTAIGAYALQANTNGGDNTANGMSALFSMATGSFNTAGGSYALYSNTNGINNTANGAFALHGNTAGSGNTAIGYYALYASTSGSNNIALGYQAGQTIVGGNSNIDIGNAGLAGDTGIIRIGSGQTATYLAGNVYASGAVFSNGVDIVSDRNAKAGFVPVQPEDVLAKVAALPISEWQYKTSTDGIRHIGPMAQDFHAAFGLNGSDDRHIATVDEGGVALAAIQGLSQELAERDAEIQELKQRLEKLEQLTTNHQPGQK